MGGRDPERGVDRDLVRARIREGPGAQIKGDERRERSPEVQRKDAKRRGVNRAPEMGQGFRGTERGTHSPREKGPDWSEVGPIK